jgi:hypothetical protein
MCRRVVAGSMRVARPNEVEYSAITTAEDRHAAR